jgi:hypothetical protein
MGSPALGAVGGARMLAGRRRGGTGRRHAAVGRRYFAGVGAGWGEGEAHRNSNFGKYQINTSKPQFLKQE